MLCDMVDSLLPGLECCTAEPAAREDVVASTFSPGVHCCVEGIDAVGKFQLLAEIVLPSEDALLGWFLEAYAVVVCCFEMIIFYIGFLAEDARGCAIVVDEPAFRRTAPLVDGEMEGLFMALPVVFSSKSVRTKSTLVRPTSPLEAICMADVFPTMTTRLWTMKWSWWALGRSVR